MSPLDQVASGQAEFERTVRDGLLAEIKRRRLRWVAKSLSVDATYGKWLRGKDGSMRLYRSEKAVSAYREALFSCVERLIVHREFSIVLKRSQPGAVCLGERWGEGSAHRGTRFGPGSALDGARPPL
jgi:hypothetical protein